MNQKDYYCQEHPSFQIGGFYKANLKTKSQRKLCIECILTRKIQPEQIISKDNFVQQLALKFDQINKVIQQGEIDSMKMFNNLLHHVDQIQYGMNQIFSCMKESIRQIAKIHKTEDDRFLLIIKNNSNPFECSTTELDQLVILLEGKSFEDYNEKKKIASFGLNQVIESLNKCLSPFQQKIELIQQIENQFTNGNSEQSMVTVKGFQRAKNKLEQTTFLLTTSKQGDQVYQKDGQILRIEKKDQLGQKNEQIIYNLEQIKYLEFKGQYGADGYKINQWNYYWKGEKIGGGIYNQKGQKQGKWQDLCDNYWDKKDVIQEGQYKDGKKIGLWKLFRNNQYIGGGQYDNQGEGIKNGYWIELVDEYITDCQFITNGYYKNGKKVGRWDIIYRGQEIGCGSYDCKLEGNSTKIGKWIELSYGFNDSYVSYVGEYQNGKRFGKWEIWYKDNNDDKDNQQIGGGSYEHQVQGDSIKIGRWIELNDGFYYNSQVTNVGEYKNGKKVGKWDIMYRGQEIGGGSYECYLEGDSNKIGRWIELSYGFNDNSQITYVGEYYDGKKFGKWEIYYKFYLFQWINKKIGGGSYEDTLEGDSVKVGQWIEQNEGFNWNSQIIYVGEYKNGKKFGKWSIWHRYYFEQWDSKLIGGGSYGYFGRGFCQEWLVGGTKTIYYGEYKSGRKVGKWKIKFHGKDIGGGNYDKKNSIKIGRWVELSDRFYNYSQVTYMGRYQNCQKVGKWRIMFEGEDVGGGFYDNQNSFKKGEWIELSDKFDYYSQVTYKGEYKNGKKVGRWVILWNYKDINQQIGGGLYDGQLEGDNSIKIGDWIEQNEEFDKWQQIVHKGEYKNGQKIGIWVKMNIKKNEKLGELTYDN